MESILVILLLLVTHTVVGTATASEPLKPEDPCQSSSFASEINLYCENRVSPTAACCASVVASVDIEGYGTAPYLCRVAAEPELIKAGLNTTDLLTMFASCRALASGGAPLEADCEDSPQPPTTELISNLHQQHSESTTWQNKTAGRQQLERESTMEMEALQGDMVTTPCDAQRLAFALNVFCSTRVVSGRCCEAVVSSVDIDNTADTPCLCLVVDRWAFLSTGLGLDDILGLYDDCTGRQGVHQLFDDIC